jgi:hypothetical protein
MKMRLFAPVRASRPHLQFSRPFLVVITGLILVGLTPTAHAMDVFNSDFSKGTFDKLGWQAKGDWSVVNMGEGKPDLANNPGPVLSPKPSRPSKTLAT